MLVRCFESGASLPLGHTCHLIDINRFVFLGNRKRVLFTPSRFTVSHHTGTVVLSSPNTPYPRLVICQIDTSLGKDSSNLGIDQLWKRAGLTEVREGPTPLIDFQGARDFPLAGVCKGRKNFHTDDVHNGHFMPKGSIIMPDILYAIPSFLPSFPARSSCASTRVPSLLSFAQPATRIPAAASEMRVLGCQKQRQKIRNS